MQCRRSLAMEHQKVKFFLTGAMCSCAVVLQNAIQSKMHCTGVECTSAMQCIFGRLGTECILSHPMHPTASIRHCASAMYHNSMQCFATFCNILQCFATFCNICKILQRFVTYRNAEDSMQPRSSSANVQKAGYSSLSWSNTKYKYIKIKFKTKQGRCETPIS